jgi:hypothetical protein
MSYSNFTEPNDTYHLAAAIFPFFRREVATNPFARANYVIVPYCTGDLHAGRADQPVDYDPDPTGEFQVTHRGSLNVIAVLDDLGKRFRRETAVVLTGSSAGGFGATYNFPEVVRRWPRTALLPDAGTAPPIEDSLMTREGAAVAQRWRAGHVLPAYCQTPDCLSNSMRLIQAHAEHHDGSPEPWLPFGYMQGQQDGTLSDYMGVSPCRYELGLRRGVARYTAPNLRAFIPATGLHTFLPQPLGFTSEAGVDMATWFAAVVEAREVGGLPSDAVDAWLQCNPLFLPEVQFTTG